MTYGVVLLLIPGRVYDAPQAESAMKHVIAFIDHAVSNKLKETT